MNNLIIPDGVVAEQVQLLRVPVRLGPAHGATCWALMVESILHIGDMPVKIVLPRYHSREDEKVRLITDKTVFDMPQGFHAMVNVFSTLITLYNSRDVAYEGDVLTEIKTKALLQRHGAAYDVKDPNEVAKWYPEVCSFLSHKNLGHPETLEALIAAISAKDTRKIN